MHKFTGLGCAAVQKRKSLAIG